MGWTCDDFEEYINYMGNVMKLRASWGLLPAVIEKSSLPVGILPSLHDFPEALPVNLWNVSNRAPSEPWKGRKASVMVRHTCASGKTFQWCPSVAEQELLVSPFPHNAWLWRAESWGVFLYSSVTLPLRHFISPQSPGRSYSSMAEYLFCMPKVPKFKP